LKDHVKILKEKYYSILESKINSSYFYPQKLFRKEEDFVINNNINFSNDSNVNFNLQNKNLKSKIESNLKKFSNFQYKEKKTKKNCKYNNSIPKFDSSTQISESVFLEQFGNKKNFNNVPSSFKQENFNMNNPSQVEAQNLIFNNLNVKNLIATSANYQNYINYFFSDETNRNFNQNNSNSKIPNLISSNKNNIKNSPNSNLTIPSLELKLKLPNNNNVASLLLTNNSDMEQVLLNFCKNFNIDKEYFSTIQDYTNKVFDSVKRIFDKELKEEEIHMIENIKGERRKKFNEAKSVVKKSKRKNKSKKIRKLK